MALVPVHGGLTQPIDRILPLSRRKQLLIEASSMPKIQVNDADLSTLYRVTDGTLSPLEGPMVEAEYDRVLESRSIERGGKAYAWTIPLSLPMSEAETKAVKIGKPAVLLNASSEVVGVLRVESVFAWDKARIVSRVYGTDRQDHPGADLLFKDPRTMLVGGTVETLPQPRNASFGQYVLSPRQTRALIEQRKWEAAVAFQTRNPLHRAHEYALVCGVEKLTRDGKYAGVVLNPLVGQLKGDDVDAVTRMRTYEALLLRRLLGKGDADEALWRSVGYELNDVFELVGLDMRMFYGGPSEAVMHAIYRQNHGFSHLVVGRKHADAPFSDGKAIWGDFDAQEVFKKLGGELRIGTVNVGFAAYYDSMGRVDLMESHPDEKPFFISGTKVRELLLGGAKPDARIMRPETAEILIESYRRPAI